MVPCPVAMRQRRVSPRRRPVSGIAKASARLGASTADLWRGRRRADRGGRRHAIAQGSNVVLSISCLLGGPEIDKGGLTRKLDISLKQVAEECGLMAGAGSVECRLASSWSIQHVEWSRPSAGPGRRCWAWQ